MDWFLYNNGLHHERVKNCYNVENPEIVEFYVLMMRRGTLKATAVFRHFLGTYIT